MNQIYVNYLESLLSKFPSNNMIRIQLAYYYGTKLKLFARALKMVFEIEQSCSLTTRINILSFRDKIQACLVTTVQQSTKQLNVSKLFSDTQAADSLKAQMLKQADLQIQLCQECNHDRPDLIKISKFSKKIAVKRQEISQLIDQLFRTISDSYLGPILLCANYYRVLNDSRENYEYYQKLFLRKNDKHWTIAQGSKGLTQINVCLQERMLFSMSLQKDSTTDIIFCSSSTKQRLKWSPTEFIGRPFVSLLMPSLSKFFLSTFEAYNESGNSLLFGKVTSGHLYTKDGWILPVEYYIDINPSIDKGISANMVICPVMDVFDCIVITKGGKIETTTENIARRLGLTQSGKKVSNIDISLLSPDLDSLNKLCDRAAYIKYHKAAKSEDRDQAQ